MQYTEISAHIDKLNDHLQQRDDAIRQCADSVIARLTSDAFQFPANEICLQPLASPSDDSRGYLSVELPSDDAQGNRGFRVRFTKNYPGYLCGLVVFVRWAFVAEDYTLTAKMAGGMQGAEPISTDLDRPTAASFIDAIAEKTANEIGFIILNMCSDSGIGREMGFHKIKQDG